MFRPWPCLQLGPLRFASTNQVIPCLPTQYQYLSYEVRFSDTGIGLEPSRCLGLLAFFRSVHMAHPLVVQPLRIPTSTKSPSRGGVCACRYFASTWPASRSGGPYVPPRCYCHTVGQQQPMTIDGNQISFCGLVPSVLGGNRGRYIWLGQVSPYLWLRFPTLGGRASFVVRAGHLQGPGSPAGRHADALLLRLAAEFAVAMAGQLRSPSGANRVPARMPLSFASPPQSCL